MFGIVFKEVTALSLRGTVMRKLLSFHSLNGLVTSENRLVGLVDKAPASRPEDPGFESRWQRDFSGLSHTSDLKNWHSSEYPARRLAL